MPLFMTEYRLPDGSTTLTQCYARDELDLDEVCGRRGMGERPALWRGRPDPPAMPSTLLEQGRLAEANHALVWVSMIAVKAGLVDAWALLNDQGLVHELAHLIHSHARGAPTSLCARVAEFERSVPGVHPCWGGAPRASAALELEHAKSAYQDYLRNLMEENTRRLAASDLELARRLFPRIRMGS